MLTLAISILEKERDQKLNMISKNEHKPEMQTIIDILRKQANEINLAVMMLKNNGK